MQTHEQQALLTLATLAAYADGDKHDHERDEIKRVAQSLAGDAGMPQLTHIYQDVLLKRVTLAQAASSLSDPAQRQLAYEMAVCVCDADGLRSAAENGFLAELKKALALGAEQTALVEREADAIAALPVAGETVAGAPSLAPKPSDSELDQSILNHAILNGALELLPQSWASMAIIPLQMKLVYRIGQAHGHQLDTGHIKEFIATAGVGMTSQYLEQFGRKLLGGLLGGLGGGLGRALGSAGTGAAFSFATTYALGQLAKRYYAGGRQMNTALLKSSFEQLLGSARQLQTDYLPQIQQRARGINPAEIMRMVKGA